LFVDNILLIVPTYMESENIPSLADKLKNALKGYDYEVLVIDDNSPDGTGEQAEKQGLKVLRRPAKLGISSAFIEGIQTTESGIVGLMDADLQHPPELIPRMLNEIYSGADLVIASRYVEGGKIEDWSLRRKIVSGMAIALAHLLLPKTRKIKDPMSGFFLLRREAIKDIGPTRNKGFKILLEILVKGRYNKVVEVPYTFKSRKQGKSKLGIGEIWNYVKHLYRLRRHLDVSWSGAELIEG
jgi:dolichol-phosphate mannosyltransferase